MNFRNLFFLIIYPVLSGSVWANMNLIGTDINFHGTVVSLACSIAPGDERVLVDFQKVSTKDLYLNKRSSPIPFSIRLADCTTDVFNSVTVTFGGSKNKELPNHLAIVADSPGGAAGVGIGLQMQNGNSIELNKASPAMLLSTGKMSLNFRAFLQGEPDALKNGAIQYGPFTAVANYTLHYQ
ncbi:fimbrial protein [Erwinia sorbitola]|nr:fimbrial protein [Erwinia sorbitola]